jgi:hypothetical protein
MEEMAVLKLKVGLTSTGKYGYPDFNSLQVIQTLPTDGNGQRMNWNVYVDVYGLGMMYDKTSSMTDASVDSPRGTYLAMIVAPKLFVDQAVAAFPAVCTKLSEADAKIFYESKITPFEDSETINMNILGAIKAKSDLSLSLTAEQTDALDPTKDQPGIVLNKRKFWDDLKVLKDITIAK